MSNLNFNTEMKRKILSQNNFLDINYLIWLKYNKISIYTKCINIFKNRCCIINFLFDRNISDISLNFFAIQFFFFLHLQKWYKNYLFNILMISFFLFFFSMKITHFKHLYFILILLFILFNLMISKKNSLWLNESSIKIVY